MSNPVEVPEAVSVDYSSTLRCEPTPPAERITTNGLILALGFMCLCAYAMYVISRRFRWGAPLRMRGGRSSTAPWRVGRDYYDPR